MALCAQHSVCDSEATLENLLSVPVVQNNFIKQVQSKLV